MVEATAIGKRPSVQGARCSRASRSVNQSVSIVTGSPHSKSATMASSDSIIRRRWSVGLMPIM